MRADVVIVGGGLAGSAAAWELSRRGRGVVLLEAFEPGHRRGSSHGSARIFRRAYPDPFYVRLTGTAADLWRQLSDEAGEAGEAGEELLRVTGAVDFGRSPIPAKMHALLTAQRVPAELLTAAEAGERWPGIVFDGADPVMFHPEGGVIDPDRAVAAMVRLAAARGALIKHGTPAIRVEARGAGAVVHTAGGSFEAPVVVVAAGAWLEPLLGGLVRLPRLEVTQVQAFHFAARPARAAETWPVFISYGELVLYGLASGPDFPGGLKVGVHGHGTVTTGDDRDGVPSRVAREQVRQFVRSRVPGLDPEPKAELTCLYTSTASEDFILDRQGPFVVCSPCSGHGAKFAPLIGALTADLADGEAQRYSRFTLAAHIQ
jgi:monomeric sarcosine oxidase